MRRLRSGGTALLETALWIPILAVMFMGTIEIARVTYTYYSLQKILSSVGKFLGTRQNVNFCADNEVAIEVAKALALSGGESSYVGGAGVDGGLILNLSPSQIGVRFQRYSSKHGNLSDCDCASPQTGCDISQGARGPDVLVIEIPEGYPIQLRIPGTSKEGIVLRPRVQMPYTGT